MTSRGDKKRTTHARRNRALAVAFVASALAVCIGLYFASPLLSPLIVTAIVALYLAIIGVLLLRLRGHEREREEQDVLEWRDVVPCYLSIQDRDLKIIATNDLFRRDFGERIGELCYQAYKHREDPCPNCPVLRTFQDGKTHSGEETVITADGRMAHVVVSSSPYYDARGKLSGVVEMATNITEVKELQRELEQTRSDYQRLFDVVPCYITVQGRDLRIVESNALFRRDFGDGTGLHCYRAYKSRDAICPNCVVKQTFADGEVHASQETVIARDGREMNMIVYSMPVRSRDGEITAVMEMSTDITEVIKLQVQLSRMGRAVASMAHRIKNVLMGLEGGVFVMNTGFEFNEDETVEQGWDMVQRNVMKVSRITKDLLYCSKEREPRFKDNVSPEAIAREVHQLFEERAAKENIDLRLEVDNPPHTRTLDPDGVNSLLTNLVGNALDACRFDMDETKRSHTITIRCGQNAAGETEISVADDGMGIPDEVSTKVFQDFFSTKGTEGTGLGLLVVKKVAEEHGGRVTFQSKPRQGTTFTVTLPLGEAISC